MEYTRLSRTYVLIKVIAPNIVTGIVTYPIISPSIPSAIVRRNKSKAFTLRPNILTTFSNTKLTIAPPSIKVFLTRKYYFVSRFTRLTII